MMLKKRGFLILVVLLFSLLYSSSVLAGWLGDCAGDKCTAIVVGTASCPLCDPGPSGAGSFSCSNPGKYGPTQCQSFGPEQGQDLQIMITNSKDCKFGPSSGTTQAQPGGCWFVVGDYDKGDPYHDDCGIARAAPGQKFGNGQGPQNYIGEVNVISGAEDDVHDVLNSIYTEDPWEYVCDDKGFWSNCFGKKSLGLKTVANGVSYECTYANGVYQWASDKDGDGYTTSEDCNDDTKNDAKYGAGLQCPTIDPSETTGKTVDDIKKLARSKCEANPGQFSQCAICVNNGAAEVCGDKVNNDCGGPQKNEKLNDLEGTTSDSCNANQASCEQTFVGHCSGDDNLKCTKENANKICGEKEECILPDSAKETVGVCKYTPQSCKQASDCGKASDFSCDSGTCKFIGNSKSCTSVSTCGDASIWSCDIPGVNAKNIYDKPFDWKESKNDGGYCCGFNGPSDAGKIISEKSSSQSYVCLSKDKDLVSTEKGFAPKQGGNAAGITEIFANSNCGEKKWCWVDAIAVNNQFKIFTVKKPGAMPFDVVSNGNEWLQCDAQGKTFSGPAAEGSTELDENSNRFYCYQEGNRMSWAECAADWDSRKNPSIKGRYTGEGLFTLPLSTLKPTDNLPDQPTKTTDDPAGNFLREYLIGNKFSVTYNQLYKNYYGKGFLDFTGYDTLSFMVRFVKNDQGEAINAKDLQLPLSVHLSIFGPKVADKDIPYFDQDILGYVINTPFSDSEGFMQVQVPINEYKDVRSLTFKANGDNKIQVRNLYLTNSKDSSLNQLCSGQPSASYSSWIANVDTGKPDVSITGEKLCKQLYGKQAWLGNDNEVSKDSANCCGNAQNEYYSGTSKEYVPTGTDKGKKGNYACWNSEPVASGDSVMDVEFQVQSQKTQYEASYSSISLNVAKVVHYRSYSLGNPEDPTDDIVKEGTIPCSENNLFQNQLEIGKSFVSVCSIDLTNKQLIDQKYRGITKLWFDDPLSYSDSPVELSFYDGVTNQDTGTGISPSSSITDIDDKEFNHNGPAQFISTGNALLLWNHPLDVVARLKSNHYFPINNPAPTTKTETTPKTYTCSSSECLFPLPGNPPYKVTNLHPDLYDLYYVTGSQEKDETPIIKADQEFSQYANIKAKRIAQQVLYYNEGENSKLSIGFYGCSAADYLSHVDYNKQSCTVVASKFCSPSAIGTEENNKDKFTVVNTWSNEALTKVGYDTASLKKPEGQNISAYYEQLQLTLKDPKPEAKLASARNHSTSAPPARNFISNPEFTTSAKKIPYWEIFSNGQPVADEHTGYVIENKVILKNGDTLRSERIAVPVNTDLHFSMAQKCTTNILLVDKNGKSQSVNPTDKPQFNTGDASYIIIEFSGACEVEKPILQIVDGGSPAEYSYQSHPELPNPDARSGAACCPDKYCWNGYACVEPMSTLTTITEHVADGRDYRCVDGNWKRSLLKFDWNNQQWGFCPDESQCFVLGSGKAENTAQTFTDGKSPICIKNGEFIMDNYCTQGNWTSRTKYLATKLLEVAQNNEYVLYCAPYKEALLDLGNNDNKLGGAISVKETQTNSLPGAINKQPAPKIINTCYKLDAEGKRLVPDSQNTCINNVCVLKYKDGGVFKVAFATTLNKPITDANSFLLTLNVPQEKLSQICQGSGKDFINCDLSGLEFPQGANLYYDKDLNAVLYARDGIQLTPGVVDKVLNWFKNLFGSGPLSEKQFVTQAQNFRNLYIASVGGKKVRAAEEIFPKVKQTLVAEYQNFNTPICDYVKNIKVPPELQLELLEEASGMEKVFCSINGTTQTVVVNAGLDFFWPQLTGKLRIGGN